MNKLFLFIIIAFSLFADETCIQAQNATAKDNEITIEEVTAIIDTLASDYYEGRGFNTEGIEKAAVYIEHYLKAANIPPYFTTYRDSFQVGNRVGYNIIGLIEGSDPELKKEYVILSAHYDHVGKIESEEDSIRNGANDNASGVSAVLNIAKLVVDNKLNKRSIIVALFSGEEIGLTGSEHFAKKVKKDTSAMYCGINIDMIGSVLTDEPEKVYLSGEKKSNIRNVFNEHIGFAGVASHSNKGYFDIFTLSDNYPLYRHLNIPAHTFCTFDFQNYKHYHRVSDEIQNLDLENTAIIVRNIAKGFVGVVNSVEREIRLVEKE